MGGRKIGIFGLVKTVALGAARWKSKGIEFSQRNLYANGWMTGGVLIFDKYGNLVYAMEESPGVPFDVDRLERAIEGARKINSAYYPEDDDDENESIQTDPSSKASDVGGK